MTFAFFKARKYLLKTARKPRKLPYLTTKKPIFGGRNGVIFPPPAFQAF